MSTRIRMAFACYFLAGLLAAAFAAVYLIHGDFIPYHAMTMDMYLVQWLNIALIKTCGGLGFAAALALLILLFVPFRSGARWAPWTISCIGLGGYASLFYAMSLVALITPAKPPWTVGIASTTLVIVALALSIPERQMKP